MRTNDDIKNFKKNKNRNTNTGDGEREKERKKKEKIMRDNQTFENFSNSFICPYEAPLVTADDSC